jgi:hypothetical protein
MEEQFQENGSWPWGSECGGLSPAATRSSARKKFHGDLSVILNFADC